MISPDIAFRCHMHWQQPWMNQRIHRAYQHAIVEYEMLMAILHEIERTEYEQDVAGAVHMIAQGLSHEASWLAWYGRAE